VRELVPWAMLVASVTRSERAREEGRPVTQEEPPRQPPPPPPPPPSGEAYASQPSPAPAPPPGMPLISYWKLVVLERYAKFDGRAARPEFWWFVLANFLIGIVFNILGQVSDVFFYVSLLYSLAVLVPYLAVAVRRLHDTDKSGWWLLIGLVPCVGIIVLIVFFATEGTRGPNRYGAAAS